MISSNSRYASSALVTESIKGKDIVFITPSAPTAYTFKYRFYIMNGSDRIDNIGAAFLGDPTQWYVIADANPQIMKWFSITPGTIIRIPTVSVSS